LPSDLLSFADASRKPSIKPVSHDSALSSTTVTQACQKAGNANSDSR